MAIKAYEQIALLYLLPALISLLGITLRGNVSFNHFHLDTRQMAGAYLIALSLIISIINFPATMFLRVRAVKDKTLPSLKECYQQGFKIKRQVYVTQIATYFLIFLGFLLLIVPGIIMLRRYVLAPYYAVENPKLSLKQVMAKAKLQTSPYYRSIFSTIVFLIIYQLFVSFIFGGYTISVIVTYLLNYAVMFILPFRYKEISTGKL